MRTPLTPNTHIGRRLPALRPHRQHGTALILSLVFLLVLTLLGITAVSTSTLQEKMAGNMKNQNVALQATEAALRDGEIRLRTLADASILAIGAQPDPNNTAGGIYSTGSVDATNDPWWQANSTPYANDGIDQIEQAAQEPRSIIESLGTVVYSLDAPTKFEETPGMKYYRIWARGVGGTASANSTLQSTYKIPGP
jgi:type IV pilus assembly protein PilX